MLLECVLWKLAAYSRAAGVSAGCVFIGMFLGV